MSNKVKYKARFLDEWLESSDKDWIERHHKDPACAFGNDCHKTFSVAGVKYLYSHVNSDEHKRQSPIDVTQNKSQDKQKQMI